MSESRNKFLAFLFAGLFVASLGAPRLFLPSMSSTIRPVKLVNNSGNVNLVTGVSQEFALNSKSMPEFAMIGKGTNIDYGAGAYYLAVIKDREPRLIADEKINGENSKVFRIVDDSNEVIYFAISEAGNLYGFSTDEFSGRTATLLTKVNPSLYSRISQTEYFNSVINPETDVVASVNLKNYKQAELKANWLPTEEIMLVYGEAFNKTNHNSKYEFQKHLRTTNQMAYNQKVKLTIKNNS